MTAMLCMFCCYEYVSILRAVSDVQSPNKFILQSSIARQRFKDLLHVYFHLRLLFVFMQMRCSRQPCFRVKTKYNKYRMLYYLSIELNKCKHMVQKPGLYVDYTN